MINNLIKNAVEASPSNDKVLVKVESDTNLTTISIHNMGVIPSDIRDQFFDKFITSGKKNGSGIGTYSAKLMIEI